MVGLAQYTAHSLLQVIRVYRHGMYCATAALASLAAAVRRELFVRAEPFVAAAES